MTGTVLRLGQHIGSNKRRVRGVVGKDKELARTRQQVYRHVAHYQPFGGNDICVARTKNLLRAANGIRAIGHCSNCLRSTDAINLGRASSPRSEQ